MPSTWAANDWISSDAITHTRLNDIGNSIRTWQGQVNANSNNLANVATLTAATAAVSSKIGVGTVSPRAALDVSGAGALLVTDTESSLTSNLYYSSGWKYGGNGYGAFLKFEATGEVAWYTAPQNSSGAGASATPSRNMMLYPLSIMAASADTTFGNNLYYSGGWKSIAAGYGGFIKFNSSDGSIEFATASSAGSADASQTPANRMKITNAGRIICTATPVYADNAAAIAGGLSAGTRYRTSTGQVMEVY